MKWENLDVGASYYYITGTLTEWLPLLQRTDIRTIVCDEITKATSECEASIAAFVLMPDHLLLIVYIPKDGLLHRYCKLWRGRSARKIVDLMEFQEDTITLTTMGLHARNKCRYAVWKEQVRAYAIWNEKILIGFGIENPETSTFRRHRVSI